MSYSGAHRPSVLGRLGGLTSTVFSAVVIWWLMYVLVRRAHSLEDILSFTAVVTLCIAIAVGLHEAGHLLVGLAIGEPARKIRVGSGPTVAGFRVRGLIVQLCLNPLGGGAVYFSQLGAVPNPMRMASLAAGPGINLLGALYGFGLYETGTAWLGAFALANAVCLVSSAMPSVTTEGGRQHLSDGMQILNLLLKHPNPAVNFEGAEMTNDARDVIVRAVEDAQFSVADEITDMHLLRALSQDVVVGALFSATGLTGRIPAAKPPETDDSEAAPHLSKTLGLALETAFRKARDIGVRKPNAAGICLGLLATDCTASRLMKEAGISDDALLKLALVTTEDEDDLRQASVISADLPLERWGTAADKALDYAFRVAAADHSPFVGTHHLVAALVADPESRGARALTRVGFVLVWKDDKSESGTGAERHGPPALSPQAALAIAGGIWRTGPTYPTGTAELCLGIVDQSAGMGAQILQSAGVSVSALEAALRSTPRETSEPAGCTAVSRGMWLLRASARMGAGRWLDARADFLEAGRAATTDEQRAVCRNNVAWVSLMSGDPSLRAEALELSTAALGFKTDQPAFIGTHAFALLENGAAAEAASMLEGVIPRQTRPRDRASNLCELAMCYARLNQPEAAAKAIAAAQEADPKNALLARAQLEVGKTASAPVGGLDLKAASRV